jgi:dihydroorotate dehydrogenase electron transfer subunit
MKQLKAKIIENKRVAPSFYKMRIESIYLAKNSKAGQFIEVKCSDSNEPLLRRPLGVHRILKDEIEILYEVVGKGTELLSGKKTGEYLDIIGPIGNGFTYGPKALRPYAVILVGGGVGIAPLLVLAQKLTAKKAVCYVIIGAKTKSGILCEKEFRSLGCFVMVSTEDGSKGHKGYATDMIKHIVKIISCQASGIYACGPHPMLHAASHIARLINIPCQVSLEERMACGVGVCLGCPVKIRTAYSVQRTALTQYEYKMVCKDGPVFNAEEIVW